MSRPVRLDGAHVVVAEEVEGLVAVSDDRTWVGLRSGAAVTVSEPIDRVAAELWPDDLPLRGPGTGRREDPWQGVWG